MFSQAQGRGTAMRSMPVLIPPDSALGILIRRESLKSRVDGWTTYLNASNRDLGVKFGPSFGALKERLAIADSVQALDKDEAQLRALEAKLSEGLLPEMRGMSPELRTRAMELMQGRGQLLRALERKRVDLKGENARELDSLKDHIMKSGLELGGLDHVYDNIRKVGTAEAFSVPGSWLAAWASARRSAGDSQYPSPKHVRVSGSGIIPAPIGRASTSSEAEVARIARERGLPQDIVVAAFREARKQGVDYRMVLAVIQAESAFKKTATSGAGARGLMQIMPDTGRGLGVSNPENLYDAMTNIRAGTKYLKQLFGQFVGESYAQLGSINPWTRGDVKKAIAAYNAGPGAVQKYGTVPPYRETRNYVVTVLRNFVDFREIFPA